MINSARNLRTTDGVMIGNSITDRIADCSHKRLDRDGSLDGYTKQEECCVEINRPCAIMSETNYGLFLKKLFPSFMPMLLIRTNERTWSVPLMTLFRYANVSSYNYPFIRSLKCLEGVPS